MGRASASAKVGFSASAKDVNVGKRLRRRRLTGYLNATKTIFEFDVGANGVIRGDDDQVMLDVPPLCIRIV